MDKLNQDCLMQWINHIDHVVFTLQVVCITLGISSLSWLFVFMAMIVLMPFIPFMQHRTHQQQQAVASLAGMLAIARSPASAVGGLSPSHSYLRRHARICICTIVA